MSQEDLAQSLGTFHTAISRYESGTPPMRVWQLKVWADALGVKPLDLIPPDWLEEDERWQTMQLLMELSEEDQAHIRAITESFVQRARAEKKAG